MMIRAESFLKVYDIVEKKAKEFEQKARDAEWDDEHEDYLRFRHTADTLKEIYITAF